MDTYTCHACGACHTAGNMVAYCASCVHKLETEYAELIRQVGIVAKEAGNANGIVGALVGVRGLNKTIEALRLDVASEREVREQFAADAVALRARLEEKDDLFLSHQIAEVRRENTALKAKLAEAKHTIQGEMMDPNGSIWEAHAMEKKAREAAESQCAELEKERDAALSRLASAERVVEKAREACDADDRRVCDLGSYIIRIEEALAAHDAQTGEGKS